MARSSRRVQTSHGVLSLVESRADGPAVVMIHGNSSAKEVFSRQLDAPFGDRYRLIAFDLPGHGASTDAPDPERTYSVHGFADAAIELLAAIDVAEAAIVGWSLGGHVALEMMGRWPGVRAVWITGTPPLGADPADIETAFLPGEHMTLTFKPDFTDDEAAVYAQETIGMSVALEPWMLEAARRADGRFRPLMVQSMMEGKDLDEKKIAATARQPLAVVSGGAEPFVSNDFLAGLDYANLWDGRVHILDGLAHAPFWEAPDTFNPLLERFLADVAG